MKTSFNIESFIDKTRCCTARYVNLLRVNGNSIEQCFAAHIVQCCQVYCSALLHLIVEPETASDQDLIAGCFRLNNIVDNIDEQCGQKNIVQCCFHQAKTGCSLFCCVCSTTSKQIGQRFTPKIFCNNKMHYRQPTVPYS